MAKQFPSVGEFEVLVLRTVWQNQPCTERQIWELVKETRDVGRTTVLKTIQRLEGKELLVRVKGTSPVEFQAALDQKSVLPELVGRFVDGVLGGSAEPLVAYLADSRKLSAKELESLKNIVRKLGESTSGK